MLAPQLHNSVDAQSKGSSRASISTPKGWAFTAIGVGTLYVGLGIGSILGLAFPKGLGSLFANISPVGLWAMTVGTGFGIGLIAVGSVKVRKARLQDQETRETMRRFFSKAKSQNCRTKTGNSYALLPNGTFIVESGRTETGELIRWIVLRNYKGILLSTFEMPEGNRSQTIECMDQPVSTEGMDSTMLATLRANYQEADADTTRVAIAAQHKKQKAESLLTNEFSNKKFIPCSDEAYQILDNNSYVICEDLDNEYLAAEENNFYIVRKKNDRLECTDFISQEKCNALIETLTSARYQESNKFDEIQQIADRALMAMLMQNFSVTNFQEVNLDQPEQFDTLPQETYTCHEIMSEDNQPDNNQNLLVIRGPNNELLSTKIIDAETRDYLIMLLKTLRYNLHSETRI